MNNKNLTASRQGLVDKGSRGRITPWRVYKSLSLLLHKAMVDCHGEFARTKLEMVANCSSILEFLQCKESVHHPKKLTNANFCKDRLCDGCQMRRALRCFAVTTKIMHCIRQEHPNYEYIFLTLTVPNIVLNEVGDELDLMFTAWNRLNNRTEVKKATKGYLRSLEITYNHQRQDYHPHFHVLLVVPKSYFTGKYYIKRDRWLDLWKEATGYPNITQVDVRKVKDLTSDEERAEGIDGIAKACAEICKYSLKSWSTSTRQSSRKLEQVGARIDYGLEGHVWLRGTPSETAETVSGLHRMLKGRRLFQYGGVMRDVKHRLGLKDGEEDDADLVNVSDESTSCHCPVCGGDMEQVRYWWDKLTQNYYLSE